MDWDNLQDNQCPKCGRYLIESPDGEYFKCRDIGCGFRISRKRFDEIVEDAEDREEGGEPCGDHGD